MFDFVYFCSGLLWSVKQDGFFTENKEKMINSALNALIDRQGKLLRSGVRTVHVFLNKVLVFIYLCSLRTITVTNET